MTEPRRARPRGAGVEGEAQRAQSNDDAERALARALSWLIPAATAVGAIATGILASLGSAILVLASGTMLGAISLLWASLRTLTGDAPLAAGSIDDATTTAHADLEEKKRRVLLALKDLERERALGKIDEGDYAILVARYREEGKAVLRELDDEVAPSREEAEQMARDFLARHGFGRRQEAKGKATGRAQDASLPASGRVDCASCGTSNETDAAFCKQCGATMRAGREAQDAKA